MSILLLRHVPAEEPAEDAEAPLVGLRAHLIQGTFCVIQGIFCVIQGTFGAIQGTFGAIQGTARTAVTSCTCAPPAHTRKATRELNKGTISRGGVSGALVTP